MLVLAPSLPPQQILYPDFEKNGIQVFMKRDDLLHPIVSGNKWRKLKYVIEDAALNNKTHLVSFGGAYSNHLLALAAASASYGFKTTAFIRGEPVQNHMLGLCRTFGMQLHFVSRSAYLNKYQLYEDFASKNESTYFIDEGGRGVLAAKGCEEILHGTTGYTHVVCAVGTGTTLAGLTKAAAEFNMKAEGICVLKGAEDMIHEVELLVGEKATIHHQFHRGGYAKTDEELWRFIRLFAQKTGILLDQVYTAKMMMGLAMLIEQGYYPPNSRILAIHTGGLLGVLSEFGNT
ncbi:MAG: pyridoxal-phosphate dependent enzyme [Bacteroidetes bacterium]|nr:MAG: pyridoxal-phosphate dependent enzyme [Bacteroidota bacterium]